REELAGDSRSPAGQRGRSLDLVPQRLLGPPAHQSRLAGPHVSWPDGLGRCDDVVTSLPAGASMRGRFERGMNLPSLESLVLDTWKGWLEEFQRCRRHASTPAVHHVRVESRRVLAVLALFDA